MDLSFFDIQRCSLVDGPGIRTTVFLKGCNLHCAWCHNPESQDVAPVMMFYKHKCIACGKCLQVCPYALKNCDFCGRCEDYCPTGAREICGKTASTESILAVIKKDCEYYERSGGGVTFSGGECMLQHEALGEILHMCKMCGISTAVDTAGAVPWTWFEYILPDTDILLYDIKCWDENVHKTYTGMSNRLILENLEKLSNRCAEKIIVRIPVIPGVNTSENEMRSIADFLRKNSLTHIELLPYHKMGEHKYEDLGLQMQHFEIPAQDSLKLFYSIISG